MKKLRSEKLRADFPFPVFRRVPPCAVKPCAVRPVFARVVGELRAADPSKCPRARKAKR